MSIELPEAFILAKQMNRELPGKQIQVAQLCSYEKLQRIGFVNRDVSVFNQLNGGKIESVESRGNVIRVKLDNGMNLLLSPEYGGKIVYHSKKEPIPAKMHLKLLFSDNTALTVKLTGMGVIQALKDSELENSYVYRRDFSEKVTPKDEKEFTFERFSKELSNKNVNIKAALVGKDAVVVGLSNSAFQDIIYRACIHPKRKASSLTEKEQRALYDATKTVIEERIKWGGKDQFTDLYGKRGNYSPQMGPNMRDRTCRKCGAKVEMLNLGGGQTFYCPACQK
jgi:formamidopyrimidine-DNA glycosylase